MDGATIAIVYYPNDGSREISMTTGPDDPFVHRHTGRPIAIVVAIGLLLVAAAFTLYASRCWGSRSGECEALRGSPPWSLLTAIAAAPAAILTWYWRTDLKKRDVRLARSQEVNARFASAVTLLESGSAGAIYALEGLAKDSRTHHWAVMETLAAAVRGWSEWEGDEWPNRPSFVRVQAAVRALGRRRVEHDPAGRRIDLSATKLIGIDFSDLDFDGANFNDADLRRAKLATASLRGATFAMASAKDAVINPSRLSAFAYGKLVRAGAISKEIDSDFVDDQEEQTEDAP